MLWHLHWHEPKYSMCALLLFAALVVHLVEDDLRSVRLYVFVFLCFSMIEKVSEGVFLKRCGISWDRTLQIEFPIISSLMATYRNEYQIISTVPRTNYDKIEFSVIFGQILIFSCFLFFSFHFFNMIIIFTILSYHRLSRGSLRIAYFGAVVEWVC